MPETLWKPTPEFVKDTGMTHFTEYLRQRTDRAFPDYQSLHQWSIESLETFWESFLEYSGVKFSQPHHQVLDTYNIPGAHWFSGMQLNYAENLLNQNLKNPAIIYAVEGENLDEAIKGKYSVEQLKTLVARCARGLRDAGIKTGDRVGGYVANVPEAIVACLACASIGAVWTSASPDFGLDALCDRFQQVEPKLLFASTHYRYGGKIFRTDEVLEAIPARIPSIKKIVAIPYPVGAANRVGDMDWQQFLGPDDAPLLSFTQAPFEHPLFILFSSGTTGAPKCIVHGAGGTLLQHRKEHQLHCNLKSGDRMLFFTTCGWMMWNWQLSALSLGTTICLYDGNPGYPDLTAIWRIVDKLNVTHFGTSGRFLESCMKTQPAIKSDNLGNLEKLACVLYTGSPLSSKGFEWVYDMVKKDVHLAGISGGTDIISCFILGNPNLPVIAGEIQCKGLAVDVVAYDDDGKPVTGKPGELVCRKPLPSMPIAFLNDPDGKKYYDAYFDVYSGVWHHGDYVEFKPGGGVIVYGRSDATLNPGGVRIGSAEIYSALDHLKFIKGAVVVGWQPPGQSDEVIVLLIALRDKQKLDASSEKLIRQVIREKRSPRHVPGHIFQISEVPVTRSGKTVELSVKAVLAGKSVSNRNALANPQVLHNIEQIREKLVEFYG